MEKHDLKILFVEDDDLMRNTIKNVLEKNARTVLLAANGEEGLELYKQEAPDIVITDIMMPVMNGLEMIHQIRRLGSNVKIVVVSAYSEKENFLKAIALGVNNFLIKPISYKNLLNVLEELANVILLEKNVEAEKLEKLQAQEELKKAHAELEDRVIERTQELAIANQQLVEFQETLQDKIEKSVTEIRLKDHIMMLQSRQAVMGEMIGHIAHQWRQPLNTIGLLTQSLLFSYRNSNLSDEMLEDRVNKIMVVLEHMSETIDDFRNFFNPNREKINFSVLSVVQKTLSFVESSFQKHKIEIDLEIEEDCQVNGYENEYSQVLMNLLINAKDALVSQNEDNRKIWIRVSRRMGKSCLEIGDNAGGISPEIKDKLFDPYFTTKTGEEGTGLGLYICKTIVEQKMSGYIDVSNDEDGAVFTIII
ncbi:MAG: response regulator [Candidatus Stygibacter australis]|nr:response regulator [Candidatus Stygibacter australis]MDP8320790.1 response regulator [Candidatus Stygibacter australis]